MKSLDLTTMENIQGGLAGNISLLLPITALLAAVGMGGLAGTGLQIGAGISFNLTGISIPGVISL